MYDAAARQRYRPSPDTVSLLDPIAAGIAAPFPWAVLFTPHANVVDVAIVTRGLGCETVTETDDITGGFRVRPASPDEPAPTQKRLEEILTRGFNAATETLPLMLLRRQAGVPC